MLLQGVTVGSQAEKRRAKRLMLRTLSTLTVTLYIAVLAECAIVASAFGNGSICTDARGSVDVGHATGTFRVGEACAHNIIGMIAVGDASSKRPR
jgi:hypothetical protein